MFVFEKVKFVHIFCRCEMGLDVRKIEENLLLMRFLRLRGVFTYPVEEFIDEFLLKQRKDKWKL